MLRLIPLARIALICATVVACLSIAHAQDATQWTAPVLLKGSDTNTWDALPGFKYATVESYTGPMGTLTGVEAKLVYDFDGGPAPSDKPFLYGVENGDVDGCAFYDGAYGGQLYVSTLDRAFGQRKEHGIGGCSFTIGMCPGSVPLQEFDGLWDMLGESGHTAGGGAPTFENTTFHQFAWAAYPYYQAGWEYSEPSFPGEFYEQGAPGTRLRMQTSSMIAVTEWTGAAHWTSAGWTRGEFINVYVTLGYHNCAGVE